MAVINLAQVASPSAPSASTDNIFIDTSGNLSVQKPDGNIVKIAAAGTYTLTIPATGTAALRDVAQTFSEAQTFSNALIAPGMQPASDGVQALRLASAGGTNPMLTIDTVTGNMIRLSGTRQIVDLSNRTTAINNGTATNLFTLSKAATPFSGDSVVLAADLRIALYVRETGGTYLAQAFFVPLIISCSASNVIALTSGTVVQLLGVGSASPGTTTLSISLVGASNTAATLAVTVTHSVAFDSPQSHMVVSLRGTMDANATASAFTFANA